MPTLLGEIRQGQGRLASRGGQPVYEATKTYLVQADYVGQTRLDILTLTPGLPTIGSVTEGAAVCRSSTAARRSEQSILWEATCEFSSEVQEGQDDQGQPQTPEVWVPIYETKKERISEVSTEDRSGKAYANSNGDPFEGGWMLQRTIPVWDFYQFEKASIRDDEILDRNETVNDAVFKGKPAKTLLLFVESTIGRYYGKLLRLNHYTIKFNKKTWEAKRLDIGPRYSGNTPFEADGVPYIGALDGAGGKQPDGTAPAVIKFDEFTPVSFATFLRI